MAYTTIDDPTIYFNTKLYTGNGAVGGDSTTISSLDFAPNLVWIKNRTTSGDATSSHALTDTVRGVTKTLSSNLNTAEATYSNALTNFSSNGFTVSDKAIVNGNGNSLVAWNWKAGTSVSGDTGGSGTAKTYTGSVNTDAGFSIIRYIGNGTAGHTIPHHLGTTPALVIARTISVAKDWNVYHHKNTSAPETEVLVLNTTAATADDLGVWNDTAPTSSVVTLGDSSQLNTNDGTCIMYAFSEKQGYSKFGSYTGNGNADGTFVYTGFKPAWVMTKKTNSTSQWVMFDNKRSPINYVQRRLQANNNAAENTDDNQDFDILSNGFKSRRAAGDWNSSGDTFIYMAFAENPFVTSTGVPACAR